MNLELEKVIETLSAHEVHLSAEMKELISKTNDLQSQLHQVQSALDALRGDKTRKEKLDLRRTNSKKTAYPEIVQEILVKALRQKQPQTKESLLRLVQTNLLSQGFSRVGVKSLFARTLQNSMFAIGEENSIGLVINRNNP